MQNLKQIEDREFVIVKDQDEDRAGATVWWRLRGECKRADLVHALEAANLDHVSVPTPGPEIAIRRAVAVLRGKRRLIRPLKRGAWAVVEEQQVSADVLKHWTGPTVSLDMIGRAVLKNATMEEAQQVREAYDHYQDTLTTDDISSWLISQVERLGAVGLREGGGIYYLPPSAIREWTVIVGALHDAAPKHSAYKVPTVRMTADGARAILDSLRDEAEAEVERLQSEVLSGDLGVRALEFRGEKARHLLSKVGEYESLLGTRLESVRDMVAKLEVEVVAAKVAAEAAADEERVS